MTGDGIPAIVQDALIEASPAKVWRVLTDPAFIERWLGVEALSDWTVGSPLVFAFLYQGRRYEDRATILRFEPERVFSYDYWSELSGLPDAPNNYSVVTFELQPSDNGTRLCLRHERIATRELYEHSSENWKETLRTISALAGSNA